MKSHAEIQGSVDGLHILSGGSPLPAAIPKPLSSSRLLPVMIGDLHTLPSQQPLIKGLLGAREMSVWFGPPGCGKSFLVMTTGLCIARGIDWFGRKVDQGLVVYIAAEGVGGIKKRLEAYGQHYGIGLEDIPFAVIRTAVDLGSVTRDVLEVIDNVNALVRRLEVPCQMIVIDTLNRCMGGGDENSSQDMGSFIQNSDLIRLETGAHVAIIHHTPKGERTSPRGHGSLLGATDVAVKIEKRGGGNTATVVKSKDDEDGWHVDFKLQQVSVGEDEDGDEITSCVVVPFDAPEGATKTDRLKGNKRIMMDALYDVLATWGNTISNRHGIPDGAICVDVEAWRKEFYARKDGNQEAKQKSFRRGLIDLQASNIIGFRDGHVWIANRDAWKGQTKPDKAGHCPDLSGDNTPDRHGHTP